MSQPQATANAPFVTHTAETAPEPARPLVEGAQSQFGYVPSPVGKMATSPELLTAFFQTNGLFQQSTLSELEREVVVMTIATHVGCHYCVAMHTALLVQQNTPEEAVCSLREATPLADERLETLRTFTLAVLDGRGEVPRQVLDGFLDAGYTERNALEVVLGIGSYTLTTYANRLTQAPLDEAFEPFRWEVTRD
jgi:AhpD family alkylhydroperoxidase